MPRGGAHGVEVAVVVEEVAPEPVVAPVFAVAVAGPLLVPPVDFVVPAPPAEDDEVLAVVVGGGAAGAGAGVTFGVGTGTARET